jgi:hypothetical protein
MNFISTCAKIRAKLQQIMCTVVKKATLESRLSLKRLRLQVLLQERGLDGSAAYMDYGDKIRQRLAGMAE